MNIERGLLIHPDELSAAWEERLLASRLRRFGLRDSLALEYWLDNSMYSRWTKPPKYFEWNRVVTEADLTYYDSLGFAAATTFACYLGPDYETAHGGFPEIGEYLAAN